ncbi:MAG: NAD-dependent epimerase/dehydratase family protein [Planctomycetota bacterium]|jgi:threonine 3-dehydrogenase
MRILVTGGAGQVGTDLIRMLSDRGADVVVFDLFPAPEQLPSGVEWIRGDVTNAPELFDCVQGVRPDVLYHFAAILSASGERMPHRCYSVNQHGTHHALEAARLFGVGQVMFASTIAVFGPDLPEPVPNEVPLKPTTMYGVTKVAGELLGNYYHEKWGLDFRGVRFPGLINAGIPGGGTTDYALWMFVDGIRHGRYECYVGPESTVPMMYMPDALRALVELSEAPRDELQRCIYNIGAVSPTADEFADAVRARVPGVEISYQVDPKRQAILDSWPSVVDDQCARSEWGWAHEWDLDRMADDLVAKLKSSAL